MEWTAFIIPFTMIFVQAIKRGEFIESRFLPVLALGFGLVCGIGFSVYYQQDIFLYAVEGVIYGATASGLYDAVQARKPE